jgi:hypothetical protein
MTRETQLPPALSWMLQQLSPEAAGELRGHIERINEPVESPRERRVRTLGHLSGLLQRHATVTHLMYESSRPCGASSASWLAREYGSWRAACTVAASMHPDGRPLPHKTPWRAHSRDRRTYTKQDVHDAIRRCHNELGRAPSYTDYRAWEKQRRHTNSVRKWAPSLSAIYRHYPADLGGWPAAREAALASHQPTGTDRGEHQ